MIEEDRSWTALLEQLRASVAQRRRTGQYPQNLEAELDIHFQRILAARSQLPRLATLRQRIEAVRRASRFSPDRIPTTTELPGGALLHRGLSRLFLRQAHGILLQVQEFADRTLEALDATADLADRPDNHRHADLIELIDGCSQTLARLTGSDGGGGGDGPTGSEWGDPSATQAVALAELARRIERLELAEAARRWRPWFGQERFDTTFDQGERQSLAAAAAAAVDGHVPVLDLWTARDDPPLAALASRADVSLGAITALRADELLTAQQVVDLVAVAYEKLAPQGRLVVSCGAPRHDGAPRPRYNPTLGPSLPARYIAFICDEAGFAAVRQQDWSAQDYLVVATR